MSLFKSVRYRVRFVRMMNGTPQSIGQKKLRAMKDNLMWKKQLIKLDWTAPLYRFKNENFYVYDVDRGQMYTGAQKDAIDPKLNKALFKDELARQLTAQAAKKSMFDIAYIGMIVLVALGVFVGIFIASNFLG